MAYVRLSTSEIGLTIGSPPAFRPRHPLMDLSDGAGVFKCIGPTNRQPIYSCVSQGRCVRRQPCMDRVMDRWQGLVHDAILQPRYGQIDGLEAPPSGPPIAHQGHIIPRVKLVCSLSNHSPYHREGNRVLDGCQTCCFITAAPHGNWATMARGLYLLEWPTIHHPFQIFDLENYVIFDLETLCQTC